jgi:hypothetical protein
MKFFRIFKGLLFEKGDNVISLGRLLLWVLLSLMMYCWLTQLYTGVEVKIPGELSTTFNLLLGYNFGKKIVDVIPKKEKEEKVLDKSDEISYNEDSELLSD